MFLQVGTLSAMVMVDADGKRLEVIVRDVGHGPQPWIRVSWHHRILLGAGYYRTVAEALKFVDVESLVEVIPLPRRSLTASLTAARTGGTAVKNAATAVMRAAAESMGPIVQHATGRRAGRSTGRPAALLP